VKVEKWQLQQRQGLPLEMKELRTQIIIQQWYRYWGGKVYVSFSGGKDSTVLLDQVRRLYPEVPAIFVDTGLEYPEIREFVKTIENVTWVRPKMSFSKVLQEYGYPVVSKKIARFIHDLQNPTDRNVATRNLRLTGMNRKGIYCSTMKLPKKWLYLVDAPFKISERCCDALKKKPFKRYIRETGQHPLTGTMAAESHRRVQNYLQNGCNGFNLADPISTPMGFWLEEDIWSYIKKYELPYSSIYDMGEKRTGCMFCMFGVHLEKGENRFQRMSKTHPKQYKYCIDKLDCGKVLDFLGVDYHPGLL